MRILAGYLPGRRRSGAERPVRLGWPCLALAAGAACPAPPAAAGWGSRPLSRSPANLTIYSSLPLQGSLASASLQIVNGEKLALAQVGGRVGRFKINYASLDDANPKTGEADPGITATNARVAAQDNATIAYIGDSTPPPRPSRCR